MRVRVLFATATVGANQCVRPWQHPLGRGLPAPKPRKITYRDTAIKGEKWKRKAKPSDSNSVVDNESNETLVEEIRALVVNATGLNCRHTDRKLGEQTKVLNSSFSAISESVRDVKTIINRTQSSGDVLNSLAELKQSQEQKSDEVKALVQKLKTTIEDGAHNFKHHRIGFETPFVFWTIVIETVLI